MTDSTVSDLNRAARGEIEADEIIRNILQPHSQTVVDIKQQKPYLWVMEVHLNPDVQAKLSRIAAERGSNAELLAREAIEHFVEYDDWFIREVESGLAQIETGAVLSHEEVGTRLERLLVEKAPARIDKCSLD